MNLNLVVAEEAPAIADHENILLNQIENIPQHSCKSLVLQETLNYLTLEQFYTTLEKIRHQGVITISSPDAMAISTALCWGKINMETFSNLTSNRICQYTLLDTKSQLEQRGYAIEIANTNEMSFYIRARRP